MVSDIPSIHEYFEFEVSLEHIEPRIWRRFLLTRSASFYDLHKAIQDAGPWQDYHLFAFQRSDEQPVAGIPDEDIPVGVDTTPNAKKVKLAVYFKDSNRVQYEYDFGDGWQLEIKLLGLVSLPYKFKRALLGGERAFPPEDSGGVGGYQRCVAFLATGVDEWEDEDTLASWLGDWRPDRFDLQRAKSRFDR